MNLKNLADRVTASTEQNLTNGLAHRQLHSVANLQYARELSGSLRIMLWGLRRKLTAGLTPLHFGLGNRSPVEKF